MEQEYFPLFGLLDETHSRGHKDLEEALDTGGLLVVPVFSEPQGQDEKVPASDNKISYYYEPPQPETGIRTELDDIMSGINDIRPETSSVNTSEDRQDTNYPQFEPPQPETGIRTELDDIMSGINDFQPKTSPLYVSEQETAPDYSPEPDLIDDIMSGINDTQPETSPLYVSEQETAPDYSPEPHIITETPDSTEQDIITETPDVQQNPEPEPQPETPPKTLPSQPHTDISNITAEDLNDAWHMSSRLNEPPTEMWTDINEPDEEDPPEYEPSMSLQGDAYIPVVRHGTNFTQRLQKILQGRRDKAEERREQEAKNKDHHPYFHRALIFCTLLVLTVGLAYAGLWLYHRYTPDYINNKAASLYEQGKFSEALAAYKSGRERYPNILTFLTGIARSAEKAGLPQTARTAWNEYINALPRDDTEHREAAEFELQRLSPAPEPPKPQEAPANPPAPERPSLPEVRPVMFDEILEEANHYHNIGMFSRAIVYFHRAMALRDNDIRPYIGLASGYRARGLYFEARRILSQARAKFGRNPTIETELLFLKGE